MIDKEKIASMFLEVLNAETIFTRNEDGIIEEHDVFLIDPMNQEIMVSDTFQDVDDLRKYICLPFRLFGIDWDVYNIWDDE